MKWTISMATVLFLVVACGELGKVEKDLKDEVKGQGNELIKAEGKEDESQKNAGAEAPQIQVLLKGKELKSGDAVDFGEVDKNSQMTVDNRKILIIKNVGKIPVLLTRFEIDPAGHFLTSLGGYGGIRSPLKKPAVSAYSLQPNTSMTILLGAEKDSFFGDNRTGAIESTFKFMINDEMEQMIKEFSLVFKAKVL